MNLNILTPRKALNKAFLKIKAVRNEFENFRTQLIGLLDRIDENESEEFHKIPVSDFLRKSFYDPNHFISTKGRTDLVIHNGKDAQSTVSVIIETKKPGNKAEMLRTDNINTKAFQELVLYYLRERISGKNLEIRHLIATDIYEWFVFDANFFEKEFAQNRNLLSLFADFEAGRLSGKTTDFFYKEIAAPAVSAIETEISFVHFDIRKYEDALRNRSDENDKKLVPLFKLFSPEHLLKLPFANDSNTLDRAFYSELLHIIGLNETKEGNRKLIQRKKDGERNAGSMLENAIAELDANEKINRLENPEQFGETYGERLFAVGLELVLTWVNRLLFLKLLEAQLIKYHKRDKSCAFLHCEKIRNFHSLSRLFFQVLARKPEDRDESLQKIFEKVPYLNSSLFEPAKLEQDTFSVSGLDSEKKLPVFPSTVLKDHSGKKCSGEMNTLEYFFAFLDAYDFAAEGGGDIQEESKTLISASVLGLIFEKINGYKDGSFFTPGFVTMYMARETVRRAVVQKFNEKKGWNCKNFDELYNRTDDMNEADAIVSSLKICDPAAGSGHFLVSALNEIIAVKSDLGILRDRKGKRLKNIYADVVNDEIAVTDEDGELFEYRPGNRESSRIQETFFHEKRSIIENCLFGVDINPNSVKICRLRLWIELLKHAYYKADGELETLPNIDISIRCGNSLISRFPLDADVKRILKKSRWTVESYKTAVQTYRHSRSSGEKRQLEKLISCIKKDFRAELGANSPKAGQMKKLTGELYDLLSRNHLFAETPEEKNERERKQRKLENEIKFLSAEMEELQNGKIYENAFEWRFEFPEVLSDDGEFTGFDIVIGNPPYMVLPNNELSGYKWTKGNNNTYIAFIEMSKSINSNKNGLTCMITPNTWMSGNNYISFREDILNQQSVIEIIQLPYDIFEVYVDTVVTTYNFSSKAEKVKVYKFNAKENFMDKFKYQYFNFEDWKLDSNKSVFTDRSLADILKKYFKIKAVKLGDIATVQRGTLPPAKNEKIEKPSKDKSYIKWFDHQVYRYVIDRVKPVKYVDYTLLRENKPIELFQKEKILGRQLISRQFRMQFAYFNEEYAFKKNLYAIYDLNAKFHYYYILSILNSSFYSFVQVNYNTSGQRDDFPSFSLSDFRNFLIPNISRKKQSSFIKLVSQILADKNSDPTSDISALEREIDRLVYDLYDLTEEEIAIVEGKKEISEIKK